jgi:hypothetical protein
MKKLFGSAMTCALLATLAFAGNAHAYYPTGPDSEDGGAGGGVACGSGVKTKCGERTVTRCLEWKTVSSNGNWSISPGGAGAGLGTTVVCSVSEVTVTYLFYNP